LYDLGQIFSEAPLMLRHQWREFTKFGAYDFKTVFPSTAYAHFVWDNISGIPFSVSFILYVVLVRFWADEILRKNPTCTIVYFYANTTLLETLGLYINRAQAHNQGGNGANFPPPILKIETTIFRL